MSSYEKLMEMDGDEVYSFTKDKYYTVVIKCNAVYLEEKGRAPFDRWHDMQELCLVYHGQNADLYKKYLKLYKKIKSNNDRFMIAAYTLMGNRHYTVIELIRKPGKIYAVSSILSYPVELKEYLRTNGDGVSYFRCKEHNLEREEY